MKKWLIVIAVIVVGVAGYIFLKGNWQVLSMLVAGLSAPFKIIAGLFGGREEQIRKRHAEIRKRETAFQEQLDATIREREERVKSLESQVSQLDDQLATLRERRAQIGARIDRMSLEELQLAGQQHFGT